MSDHRLDSASHDDPYRVLGLAADAREDDIRRAYLRKVKEHPPEQDSEEFERVRDAYASLRDPRVRMQRFLLETDPEAPMTSILESAEIQRRFVGPTAWLAALKES